MPFPKSLQNWIQARAPGRRETLGVFSVVAFAVFSWTVRGFLFKIPAFTLYFGLSSDLAILSYMFAFALLESLLITSLLLILATLLPAKFLRDGFAYKGFVIVLVATIAMILFELNYKVEDFKDILAGNYSSVPPFVIGLIVAAFALYGLLRLSRFSRRLQGIATFLTDQLSLFTYIYVPLGVIGLAVVLVRNLL